MWDGDLGKNTSFSVFCQGSNCRGEGCWGEKAALDLGGGGM